MTRDNILKIIATVSALLAAVITIMWPAQAGTYGELLKLVVALAMAIVGIMFPVQAAAFGISRAVGMARARNIYKAGVDAGVIPMPIPQSSDAKTLDDIMKWIEGDCTRGDIPCKEADGSYAAVPFASRLLTQLQNRWDDPNVPMTLKMQLLQTTMEFASKAFVETTGLAAPAKYSECDDVQEYWFNNKVNCKIASSHLFRMVLSPIRNTLRIRDTGRVSDTI